MAVTACVAQWAKTFAGVVGGGGATLVPFAEGACGPTAGARAPAEAETLADNADVDVPTLARQLLELWVFTDPKEGLPSVHAEALEHVQQWFELKEEVLQSCRDPEHRGG